MWDVPGHAACYRPRRGTRPRMSTQAMGTTARPQRVWRRPWRRLRLDTVVMAAAIVSLIVLVVLPLAFLMIGSFWSKQGASLGHFTEIVGGARQLSSWEAW